MRILVDIGETQIQALDELSKRQGQSRAALIRRIIDDFIQKNHRLETKEAFGLWGKQKIDGLEYQERVRGEW